MRFTNPKTLLVLFAAIIPLVFSACDTADDEPAAAPTVEITSHADGAIINANPVALSGTISDSREITGVTVSLNGADVSGASTLVFTQVGFSFELTLIAGSNSVSVAVTNKAGKTTTVGLSLTFETSTAVGDVTAPAIAFTSHADNDAVTGSAQVSIAGTLTETGTVVSLQVGQGGTDVTNAVGLAYTDTGFSFTATLVAGANAITVTAMDDSGNTGSAVLNLTYTAPVSGANDVTAPTVTIGSHTTGATIVSPATITVSGTLSDDGTITTLVVINNNDNVTSTVTPVYNQTDFSFDLELEVGSNVIEVEATDEGGNQGSATITLTYSPTTPAVSIESHNDGVLLNAGATITLTGSIANFESITSFKVFNTTVDVTAGASLVYNLTSFSADVTLAEVTNDIEVQVVGPAGAYAAHALTINYDVTPPAISYTSHTNNEKVIGARTVTISGTLTDNDNVAGVNVTQDGNDVSGSVNLAFDQAVFSFDTTLRDRNNNRFVVTAMDDAGNTSPVTLDLGYPYLTFTDGQNAANVIGQDSFTEKWINSNGSGDGGITGQGFDFPAGTPFFDGTDLFVPDTNNNRYLRFNGIPSTPFPTATLAVGQLALNTNVFGTSDGKLYAPRDISFDGGKMVMTDQINSRIVIDNNPGGAPPPFDVVVGQTDMAQNAIGCAINRLKLPFGSLAVDGKLFVADTGNNRVMIWDPIPTGDMENASIVLGQVDFNSCAPNGGGGATDSTLNGPFSVWSDGTRIIVADTSNNRVLIWNSIPAPGPTVAADLVLGQCDFNNMEFDENDCITGSDGPGAKGLNNPEGVISNGNQIFVSETGNSRVLIWDTEGLSNSHEAANRVLGQADFLSGGPGLAQNRFDLPVGLHAAQGKLIVGDAANNRVLIFDAAAP